MKFGTPVYSEYHYLKMRLQFTMKRKILHKAECTPFFAQSRPSLRLIVDYCVTQQSSKKLKKWTKPKQGQTGGRFICLIKTKQMSRPLTH